MLTSGDSDRIAKAVLSRVSRYTLPIPTTKEREPQFTARVLMPRAIEALRDLDIPGLTLHGDGAAPAPVTTLPSCEFHPDIALLYQRGRVVAFEVKFLRSTGRQYSLAAAIGQAAIYKSQGFESVGTILVDLAPVLGDAPAILSVLEKLGLFGHIFNKSGSTLNSYR